MLNVNYVIIKQHRTHIKIIANNIIFTISIINRHKYCHFIKGKIHAIKTGNCFSNRRKHENENIFLVLTVSRLR